MTSVPVPDAQQVIAAKLANVANLPEWLQVPMLGRDTRPLADVVVSALQEAGLLKQPDEIVIDRQLAEAITRLANDGNVKHWLAQTEAALARLNGKS